MIDLRVTLARAMNKAFSQKALDKILYATCFFSNFFFKVKTALTSMIVHFNFIMCCGICQGKFSFYDLRFRTMYIIKIVHMYRKKVFGDL